MTLFQGIVLLFILFTLYKLFSKYREKAITPRELILWFCIWGVAGLVTIAPSTTSLLATQLGIGRGVDLAVYLALFALFYLFFKMLVRIEKIEQNLTEIIRILALSGIVSSVGSKVSRPNDPGKSKNDHENG